MTGSTNAGHRPRPALGQIVKPIVTDGVPLRNAWPNGGVRIVACLACDVKFTSWGRHERMCSSCRRRVS